MSDFHDLSWDTKFSNHTFTCIKETKLNFFQFLECTTKSILEEEINDLRTKLDLLKHSESLLIKVTQDSLYILSHTHTHTHNLTKALKWLTLLYNYYMCIPSL